jgi:hypothetical protein
LYPYIRYFCVSLPEAALGISQADLLLDVMAVNLQWEKVAQSYCAVSDRDDAGDEAKVFEEKVATNVETLLREYEKLGKPGKSGTEARGVTSTPQPEDSKRSTLAANTKVSSDPFASQPRTSSRSPDPNPAGAPPPATAKQEPQDNNNRKRMGSVRQRGDERPGSAGGPTLTPKDSVLPLELRGREDPAASIRLQFMGSDVDFWGQNFDLAPLADPKRPLPPIVADYMVAYIHRKLESAILTRQTPLTLHDTRTGVVLHPSITLPAKRAQRRTGKGSVDLALCDDILKEGQHLSVCAVNLGSAAKEAPHYFLVEWEVDSKKKIVGRKVKLADPAEVTDAAADEEASLTVLLVEDFFRRMTAKERESTGKLERSKSPSPELEVDKLVVEWSPTVQAQSTGERPNESLPCTQLELVMRLSGVNRVPPAVTTLLLNRANMLLCVVDEFVAECRQRATRNAGQIASYGMALRSRPAPPIPPLEPASAIDRLAALRNAVDPSGAQPLNVDEEVVRGLRIQERNSEKGGSRPAPQE